VDAGAPRSRSRVVLDVLRRAFRDEPLLEELPSWRLPRRYRIYQWLAVVFVLNFVCFVIVDLVIGGDAWSGKREGGRYFLWGAQPFGTMKKHHEVSRQLFLYSWWHATSVLVTWPILMFLGWRLHRIKTAAQAEWSRARNR
jgi:hypothetical protein